MIHEGDVGALIRITPETDINLSSASSAQIRYRKPSGAAGAWVASITTSSVEYTTQAGDIDEAGDWLFQAYVNLGAWSGSTTIARTKVGRSLTA